MKLQLSLLVLLSLLSVSTPATLTHQAATHPQAHDILVDVTESKNVTNLDATNWILGNLTVEQYQAKRFQIASKYNISNCPPDKPFVFTGKTTCEQCPPQTVFNLETQTCTNCPAGQIFSDAENRCITPPAYVTNLDAPNWVLGNLTPDKYSEKRTGATSTNNITQCPLTAPFVLKGKTTCQQCPKETPIFCLQNDTCIGCDSGKTYNEVSKQCQTPNKTEPIVAKPENKAINVANLDGKNWILGNITIEEYNKRRDQLSKSNNVTQCDIKTPYASKQGGQCKQCPAETPIFALENSTCIPCPKDTEWKEENKTCIEVVTAPQAKPNTTEPKVTSPQPTLNNTVPQPTPETNPNTEAKVTSPQPPSPSPTTPQAPPNPLTPSTNTDNGQPRVTSPQPLLPLNPNANTKVASPVLPTPNNTKVSIPQPYADIDFCNQFKQCNAGQYFSYDQNACKFCDIGQYFDVDVQTCLFCGDSAPLLNASYSCVSCPRGTSINRVLNKCQ